MIDAAHREAPLTARRALLRTSLAALDALTAVVVTACDSADGLPEAGAAQAGEGPGGRELSDGALTQGDAGKEESKPREGAREGGTAEGGGAAQLPKPGAPHVADTPRTAGPAERPATCARPTSFEPFVDLGPRTSFRSTKDSNTLDWVTVALSMSLQLVSLPERLFGWLRQLEALQLGYPSDLLKHSLQTATRARRAGASDDLVLAALCHRLGMAFTIEGYAEVSAAFLRGYVSDEVYHVVRHFEAYAPRPSDKQGGDLRARFRMQPWHQDAVRFADEWATPFYDPNYDTLTLADFHELASAKLGGTTHDPYLTRVDCFQPQVAP